MSIWRYADRLEEVPIIRAALEQQACPFCRSDLETLRDDQNDARGHGEYETDIDRYWVCPMCGWWKGYRSYRHTEFAFRLFSEYGAAAALRTLDLADISVPAEEVRSYLAAKYEARFEIHPRLFELAVASVFRDHGYEAEATAYSNDGGIDVVLSGKEGQRIGVQVKRYQDSIEVDQIRSFVGAMVLKGFTKGIFVTTSTFQKGAPKTAAEAALVGLGIELQDAARFFDSLKIAQREMYRSKRELKAAVDPEAFVRLNHENYRRS